MVLRVFIEVLCHEDQAVRVRLKKLWVSGGAQQHRDHLSDDHRALLTFVTCVDLLLLCLVLLGHHGEHGLDAIKENRVLVFVGGR